MDRRSKVEDYNSAINISIVYSRLFLDIPIIYVCRSDIVVSFYINISRSMFTYSSALLISPLAVKNSTP